MNKKLTVIVITLIFSGYFLLLLGAYILGYQNTLDIALLLCACIPIIALYYLFTTLFKRLKEIKEEDDDVTRKY